MLTERMPPGGLFLSELWSPLGWRPAARWQEARTEEGLRVVRLVTPGYDLERDAYRIGFEHIVLRGDELVERFDERHDPRLRTPMQTRALLARHGWETVAFTKGAAEGKTFEPPAADDLRVMAIARRA